MKFLILLGLLAIQTVSASEFIQCKVSFELVGNSSSRQSYGSFLYDLSKEKDPKTIRLAGLENSKLTFSWAGPVAENRTELTSFLISLSYKDQDEKSVSAFTNIKNRESGDPVSFGSSSNFKNGVLSVWCSTNLE